MLSKIVVGFGDALELAVGGWRETDPALHIETIALAQDASYRFDLSALDPFDAQHITAFVALDQQFLNFRRFELMGEMKARGFKLPPLICCGALVAADVRIQENCVIGAGAIIGCNSRIGFNTVIGAGANVGMSCEIGNSVWIEPGVLIGRRVKIGSNAVVGQGVSIGDRSQIGRYCVVQDCVPSDGHISPKTFLHRGFDQRIEILDRSGISA